MLAELRIKSLGIIEELIWAPGSGLNVITGETGAGKSLVVDAITSLIEGELDEASIRHGAEFARLEGVFFVLPGESSSLAQLLSDKGVSVDEDALVLSAEFRRHGRGVFRLNGNAVPRASLREAGRLLVNIHSQSEHLALFESKHHLDYLDAYGRTTSLREQFRALFLELSGIQGELSAMDKHQADRAHREDILTYQIDEIKRADLKEDEERELTRERQVMGSSEKLKSLSYEACQALDGDDGGAGAALSCLHRAREALRHLAAIDPTLKASLSVMEETYLSIEELNRDIKVYQEKLEYDPDRVEEIDARLELLRSLKKKYGGNISAIKEYLVGAEMEMAAISSSDEKRALLENQISCLKVRMGTIADELSVQRKRAAKKLAAAVKKELAELNLKQVVFEIHLSRRQDPMGIPLREGFSAFCRTGADDVEFLVSTNPGEPLKPLEAIASTGELSRFTLALKVALAEADKTPVLVFDEIDIGIGGRSGEVVGQKLWRLARHHQVLCVTHLPQIAAYGEKHYRVEKDKLGERTVSRLYEVTGASRLKELTDMIGGASPGEAASRTAAELIKNAAAWVALQSS